MNDNLASILRLLLVTDDALLGARDPVATCQAAIAGGVTAVQLRLKRASDRELLAISRRLVAQLDVPLFINDRLDVAIAAKAFGVHLGPDDLAPRLARRAPHPDLVIGASVGSAAEIPRGNPADYWGVGPFRVSTTKPDAGDALGLEGSRSILMAAGGRPCVAIGGVVPDDVPGILAAGFAGVAVVSGILGEEDVRGAAGRYLRGERREERGEKREAIGAK